MRSDCGSGTAVKLEMLFEDLVTLGSVVGSVAAGSPRCDPGCGEVQRFVVLISECVDGWRDRRGSVEVKRVRKTEI